VPECIAVVGVCGGEPVGKEARAAIEAASLVAGAPRHLRTLTPIGARALPHALREPRVMRLRAWFGPGWVNA